MPRNGISEKVMPTGAITKPRLTREQIAQRAALELPDGAYVNLGWGIPNLIAGYLPDGISVYFLAKMEFSEWGLAQNPAKKISTWWTP